MAASKGPRDRRVRKYRLDEEKIREARRVLDTADDTATIEAALDLVLFCGKAVRQSRPSPVILKERSD